MSLFSELRSGKFTIYAQWCALLSLLFLVLFGALYVISTSIAFAVVAFIFAIIILFIEVPFLTRCCPTSPGFDRFVKRCENSYFRAALYLVFAIVIWMAASWTSLIMITTAITLTLAAIFYALAALTHQERATSVLTGGSGAASVAYAGAGVHV